MSPCELFLKNPRDYIRLEYELRKARRPSYSMRAFARDLQVSASGLNDFMKGRVGLSEKRVLSLSHLLGWSPARREHFQDLIWSEDESQPARQATAQLRVRKRTKAGSANYSMDVFKAISEWQHLAILEITTIDNHLSEEKIAQKLQLHLNKVRPAIRRLIKLGLLEKTSEGLRPDSDASWFGDEGQSEAVKNFHSQILSLADRALEKNESAEHDSFSLVFSIPSEALPKIHQEIRKSVLQILTKHSEKAKPDLVQALTLQSFSISEKMGAST